VSLDGNKYYNVKKSLPSAGYKTGMLTAETWEFTMEIFLAARKIEGFTLDENAEWKVALHLTSPLFLSD
jgi:hypothetical protein